MKKIAVLFTILFISGISLFFLKYLMNRGTEVKSLTAEKSHWFLLHRKSSKEYLYLGRAGDKEKSRLIRSFTVKTGRPGERPTPLPQLLGKKYWLITKKQKSGNPETAPYFIILNIPAPTSKPFGPEPYKECGKPASTGSFGEVKQCNWSLPGEFGLHGVNGNESRLSPEDPGSSGCIRHRDEDITYIYNLIDPEKKEVRYYIEDI